MAQAIIERSIIATGDEADKLRRTLGPAHLEALKKILPVLEALKEIQPVLEGAEWISAQFAQNWLTQVRHAGYAISDLVDGLQITSVPAAGKTIKWITAGKVMVHIHSEFNRLGLNLLEVTEAAPAILGRDCQKQRIMGVLSASDSPLMILPIFGLPAIGKTALARTIFHDTRLPDEYNHRVWVNVSGKVNLAKIGNSIISEVPAEGQEGINIKQRLQELFNGKKVLVVLDDLWDEESVQLESMMSMLTFGDKVTVIITTRDKYTANKFCTVEPQELNPLSDDTCWTIIKQESRFQEARSPQEQQELVQLGMEIAKKCGGVPVSAQVFGRLLRHRDVSGWQEVMQGATWYQFPAALELCYRRMIPYQRMCLAYCGIFPRGHGIAKDDLIRQWIALDLIEPSDKSSATQLACKYFDMLLDMAFLHPTKSNSTSGGNGSAAILFTMHDLAREFARYSIGEELIVLDARMDASGNERCRYALLANSNVGPLNLCKLPPNIRALYSVGCSKMERSGDLYSSAMCLRVLAFIKCSMQKLPDSICQLWNLRYLNLSGCSGLEKLPLSFGKLINLVHVDLSGCSKLANLPGSFGNLITLVHLDLSGCSELVSLPESFVKLINVVHVDFSECSKLANLPESFGELINLVHLDLSGCSGLVSLPKSFVKLKNVVHVDLSGCSKLADLSKSFEELINLVHLDLSGCFGLLNLPKLSLKLAKLVYIDLSGCSILAHLPDSFGELINLVHLDLSGCSKLADLPESFGELLNLVHINLSGCSKLKNLPKSFGKLKNLVHVNLAGCCRLVNLPESFGNLKILDHVNLAGCYGIAILSEPLKNLTKLVHLDLSFWSCFEVIKVLHFLTNLEHLNLSKPCCSTSIHRSQLHELTNHLGKLTKLRCLNLSMFLNPISFYMKEEQIRNYIESCIGGLSNLEYLDLSHNTFLCDLPRNLCGLQKLHTLDLSGCIRLTKVPREIAEMESLKLIRLRKCRGLDCCPLVVRCDGAHSNSIFFQLDDVQHCEELEISRLEKVKSTEDAQRIRLAEKNWVRTLKLCWTPGSQGYMQDSNALLSELVPPHSLQCLELHGYIGKTCFPTWLTSDTFSFNLLNIAEFTMDDIPSCSRLPPLGLLPNLQRVTLRKMASIRRIDAGDLSGGNSAAFNQLSKLTIDDMESLEEFSTAYCRGGEEFVFPEIDELVLRKCPKLRLRPPRLSARNLEISDCDIYEN